MVSTLVIKQRQGRGPAGSDSIRALQGPGQGRSAMERNNETLTDFILLGPWPELSHLVVLICLILLVYFAAVVGNAALMLLIWLDPRLHSPMYFLLSQLSFIDLALISTSVPKMVTNFFSGKRTISQAGCGIQIFFSLTLGIAECLLLTLMSYDRYITICNPLRYPAIMSHTACTQMVLGSWVGGAVTSLAHTAYAMHFPICRPRKIPHFLCEVMALLKLTCEDTSAYVKSVVVSSFLVVLIPLSLILASYALILLTVLRMSSPEGRNKALATCSSHLGVVSLYFGPAILVYMRPGSSKTPGLNQSLFMFNAILTPMLNPLIYSLRNRDVTAALRSTVASRCPLRNRSSLCSC
ncbi:olfactory receptor 2L2 [Tupaia chinensis]|uniref:olfactory receptor 2L2 n=1 Tax=Tupaia chinensis TaxID=246437 RepID=UPI0003C91898|nr:olfactory receptor 2L2 [Tupaia chinensis]